MADQPRNLNMGTLRLPASAFGAETMEAIMNGHFNGTPTVYEQVHEQIAANAQPQSGSPDQGQQQGSQNVQISPEEYAALKQMQTILPALQTPEFLRAYAMTTGLASPNVQQQNPQQVNPGTNDAGTSNDVDSILAGIMNDVNPSNNAGVSPAPIANNQNVQQQNVMATDVQELVQNGINPVAFNNFVNSLSKTDYMALYKIWESQQQPLNLPGQQAQQPQPQQPQSIQQPLATVSQPASFELSAPQYNLQKPFERGGWGR